MTARVSAVIPVSDGARYLSELLGGARARGRRRGRRRRLGLARRLAEIARAAGARAARDRRPTSSATGAPATSAPSRRGRADRFLTQDATPAPGGSPRSARRFALGARVGAVFGPHLPRPDTSPMIARELTEFFAGFAPDGAPVVQRHGDADLPLQRQRLLPARVLGADPLPRRALRRGPGVRARAARRPAGAKVYHPARGGPARPRLRAAWSSCAATSTSTAACARRSATSSRSALRRRVRDVRAPGRGRPPLDARARLGRRRGARAGPAARLVHHTGRKVVLRARLARRPAARAGAASGSRSSAAARPGGAARPRQRSRIARQARASMPMRRWRAAAPRARPRCSTPCRGHGRARAPAHRVRRSRRSAAAAAGTTRSSSCCCGWSGWATRARSGSYDPRGLTSAESGRR